jgi:monothiol glutaredoxin
MDIQQKIKEQIQAHPVIVYMKGTKDQPQCGFSSRVVQILKKHGINFHTVDILQDDQIRQGIKDFSNWPTLPQLYVKGEFIGGCDIVTEMDEAGELKDVLASV